MKRWVRWRGLDINDEKEQSLKPTGEATMGMKC